MGELLIAAIQKRPCFYDKTAKSYHNKFTKEKTWNAVSAIGGLNVKQCQIRWRALRDRYVREMAKKYNGEVSKTPWRYLNQLSFLQDHIQFKRSVSMLDLSSSDEQSVNPTEIVKDTETDAFELPVNLPRSRARKDEELYEEEIIADRAESPPKKRLKMSENVHDHFDKLCDAVSELISRQKRECKQSRNADFLRVLDGYLLKHTEEDQDSLKIKILNIVYSYPVRCKE